MFRCYLEANPLWMTCMFKFFFNIMWSLLASKSNLVMKIWLGLPTMPHSGYLRREMWRCFSLFVCPALWAFNLRILLKHLNLQSFTFPTNTCFPSHRSLASLAKSQLHCIVGLWIQRLLQLRHYCHAVSLINMKLRENAEGLTTRLDPPFITALAMASVWCPTTRIMKIHHQAWDSHQNH